MNRTRVVLALVVASVSFSSVLAGCSGGGNPSAPATPAAGGTAAPAGTTAAAGKKGGGLPSVTSLTFTPAQANNAPTVTDSIRVDVKTTDPDGDGVTTEFKWFVNGAEVFGESMDTLRPAPNRFKKTDKIDVQVFPKDTHGNVGLPFTATIFIRNSIPTITSRPTGSLNGYQAVVSDTDIGTDPTEKHTWSLEAPLPGFAISPQGVLSFDPVAGKESNGKNVTIMVVDSAGASAKQTFDVRF